MAPAKKSPAKKAATAQPAKPPQRAQKPPEKQSKRVLALCYVAIPIAAVLFVLGLGGVAVLLDEPERTHWYAHTQFADIWRMLVQKNPFYATVCVNGSAVTMLMLGTRLHEHRKALAAERALHRKIKAKKGQ